MIGVYEEAESLSVGWLFLLGGGFCILGCIGMDCSENMVLSEKFNFGALVRIFGGLLGFSSEEGMGRTRSVKRYKR